MYTIKLVHGLDAAIFLEQWSPGGVAIRPDLIGCYRTARGEGGTEALQEAIEMWELRAVRFDLTALLKVAFLPDWHWKGASWADEHRDDLAIPAELARLRRHWRAGPPLDDAAKLDVLRNVQRVGRSWGQMQRLVGEVPRAGASDPKVVVFDAGVVQYPQTPHPVAFLAAVGKAVLANAGG